MKTGASLLFLIALVAEIIGDQMHFNAISRLGQPVDSGVISRRN